MYIQPTSFPIYIVFNRIKNTSYLNNEYELKYIINIWQHRLSSCLIIDRRTLIVK